MTPARPADDASHARTRPQSRRGSAGRAGRRGSTQPATTAPQNAPFGAASMVLGRYAGNVPNGGYARASYASGGGGASRMPQIAGDATTADSALVSCVLVS